MKKIIFISQVFVLSTLLFASELVYSVTLAPAPQPSWQIISEIDGNFNLSSSDVEAAGYTIASESEMMSFIDGAIADVEGISSAAASALNACRTGASTCYTKPGFDGNSWTFYPMFLGFGGIPAPGSEPTQGGEGIPVIYYEGGSVSFGGGFGIPEAVISLGGGGNVSGWLAKPVPLPPALGLMLFSLIGLPLVRRSSKTRN